MRRAIGNARFYYGSLLVLGFAAAILVAVALLTLGTAQNVGAAAASLPAKTYKKATNNGSFGGLPNNEVSATVACDAGDRLLSGGYLGAGVGTHIIVNAPDPTVAQRWYVQWHNDATVDKIQLIVLCSDLRPGQPPR
jgi:hypothetical protein